MSKQFVAMVEVCIDPALINDFTGMNEQEAFDYFKGQLDAIFSSMDEPDCGMRVTFLEDTAKIVEVSDSAADKQD